MKTSNTRAAFTLVELMVAIAIVGIVSIVILNIFDTTSQNYYEVNQLADLNNRVRFATETLRNQLQGAGSQGSPDSANDPRFLPAQAGVRVAGLIPYNGWQDDRLVLPPDLRTNNPEVSFDGIVVVGAYDFPLSFEFAGMEDPGPPRNGRIYADKRGLFKLTSQDLFDPTVTPPAYNSATHLAPLVDQWQTRILRVADRQGFNQFVGFSANPVDPPSYDDVDHPFVHVPLVLDTDPLAPMFKGSTHGNQGLDQPDAEMGDVGYDAGLLDAFWFHVVPSVSDPNVMTLVRERLCADAVAQNALAGAWNPAAALAPTCNGVTERIVLASNVADFQVWFDCADTTDGAVRANDWDSAWQPNDHAGDCMDDTAPDPGEVRGGHVRLALHTGTERADLAHIQFEDAAGAVCATTPPFACAGARLDSATLRTYDLYPDTVGAARVVVMQSDFEIVNFVNRNVVTP